MFVAFCSCWRKKSQLRRGDSPRRYHTLEGTDKTTFHSDDHLANYTEACQHCHSLCTRFRHRDTIQLAGDSVLLATPLPRPAVCDSSAVHCLPLQGTAKTTPRTSDLGHGDTRKGLTQEPHNSTTQHHYAAALHSSTTQYDGDWQCDPFFSEEFSRMAAKVIRAARCFCGITRLTG